VAECLRGFVIIHEGLSSFPEIFLPISSLLQEILDRSELPGSLQDIFHEVIDLIKKRSDEHYASREPLRMRKKKPEPIKQLNPKFEEKYVFFGIICFRYTLFCSVLLSTFSWV
jgi:nucleolar protein 14